MPAHKLIEGTALDGLKLTDHPPDSTWERLHSGSTVIPDAACVDCPILGTSGHETCRAHKVTTPPPDDHRMHLSTLRSFQWLLHRLGEDVTGILGWPIGGQNILINARVSLNYADATTWIIKEIDGDELVLALPGDADPRRVLLYQFRVPSDAPVGYVNGGSVWGMPQPGMRLRFVYPIAIYAKTQPTIVQIVSCTATRLRIKVDADCTYAIYSCDTANPDPDEFNVEIWCEAGDRQKWLAAPSIDPDRRGGGRRCLHCRRDHSESIGNYNTNGDVAGVTINQAGEHWYCARATYSTGEMVDTDDDGYLDTFEYDTAAPSGIEAFPDHGYCALGTACDKYEAVGDAAWHTKLHAGQFFQAIWAAVDTCLEQGIPGVSSHRNYTLYRVMHPSLMSLVAGANFYSTPAGIHAQKSFWRVGGYGRYEVVEDGDDTTINWMTGGAWRDLDDYATVEFLDSGTWPPDGMYPTDVTDFEVHHDPLDYDASLAVATDPSEDIRKHIERMGIGVELDEGTWAGRGVARWPHVQEVGEPVVIPAVLLDVTGEDQVREAGLFRRLATPVTIGGVDYGGYIELEPIRQDAKDEVQKWTRTVETVTSLGDNRYRLTLANAPHRAGFPYGDPGARFDRIYEWDAGGGEGFPSHGWSSVRNYYAVDKTVGSAARGVMRGDTASFDLTVDGQSLATRRFLVTHAEAHGGATAATWGDEKVIRRMELGGFFAADEDNTFIVTDPELGALHGPLYCPTMVSYNARSDSDTDMGFTTQASVKAGVMFRNLRTDELVKVSGDPAVVYIGNAMTVAITRGVAGTTPAAILAGDLWEWQVAVDASTDEPLVRRYERDRPELSSGECWADPRVARLYFHAANVSQDLVIWYSVEGQAVGEATCYDEAFTVPNWAAFTTDLDWTTYATMTPRVLELLPEGTELTYGAGDPGDGEHYTLYQDGSVVAVRCVIELAGRQVELELTTGSVLSAPPSAVALCADYLDFGRDQDIAEVHDESGLVAAAGASLEDIDVTFWWSAGPAWMPPIEAQLTLYAVDSFGADGSGDTLYDHASRRVWLTEDWLASSEGNTICLRTRSTT